MSAVFHIFKKDMHRFRWAWITLLLSAVLEIFLYGTNAGFESSSFRSFLEICSNLGASLLGIVLIVMVVQQEPLLDPDSYWLSKPIPRISLLWSKLLFIFLFIILPPSAGLCATLILNDGSPRLVYGISSILSPLIWSLVWLFLAANTRSFPRFLLLLATLVIGFYVLLFAFLFSNITLGSGVLPARTPLHIALLIQVLLWIIGLLFALHLIYTTRNLFKGWAPLLLCLLLSMVMNPGDVFIGSFHNSSDLDDVSLAQKSLLADRVFHEDGEVYTQYNIQVRIPGIAANETVWARISHAEVTNPDETTVDIAEYNFSSSIPAKRISPDVFELHIASIDEKTRSRIVEPFKLDTTLEIFVSELTLKQTFPLQEDMQIKDNGNRLAVVSYSISDAELQVQLKAYLPGLLAEPKPINTSFEPLDGIYFFEATSSEEDSAAIPGKMAYDYGFSGTTSETTVKFDLPENTGINDTHIRVYKRFIAISDYVFLDEEGLVFSSEK